MKKNPWVSYTVLIIALIAFLALAVFLVLRTGPISLFPDSDKQYGFQQSVSAAISAVTGILTLFAAAIAALYAKRSAQESKPSADVAHAAFVSDQRAWLSLELKVVEPLQFDNGEADIGVKLEIENIGKTPAFNVRTDMEMRVWSNDNISAVREIADRNRKVVPEWSKMLPPGKSYMRGWRPSAATTECGHSAYFVILGVVTYQTMPLNSIHQTGFCYLLQTSRKGDAISSDPIITGEKVPADKLVVEAIDGGFAD